MHLQNAVKRDKKIMSKRIKFFLGHLTLSLFVISLIIGFIFLFWYPLPLAKAVGVTNILLILALIDLIIGPVLGFLVYKEGKKTLKFDLTIIVLVQVIALTYGVYSVSQGRPAWIVYNVDRFEVIKKNEIIQENIKEASQKYQTISWLKPQFVAATFAKNQEQRQDDMFTEIFAGVSIAQRPERYVELSEVQEKIKSRAKNLSELSQYNQTQHVEKVLNKYPEANAWLPLKASAVDMVVLINTETTEIIKIVDLRPWN